MPLDRLDISGSPYLGVYCASNERCLFVPINSEEAEIVGIAGALEVEPVRLSLGGSTIMGSLMCTNSTGALVPSFAESAELEILKEHLEVGQVDHKLNALGNNILVSERAAMVHPKLPPGTRKLLEDTLGVEVVQGTIAGLGIVGAAAVVTSKGILSHPKVTIEEKESLEELFGLELRIGTANYGAPLLGACMVANSKGCAVGSPTTGIELGRIEEALDLFTDHRKSPV
jgi:translation initiation factor 6